MEVDDFEEDMLENDENGSSTTNAINEFGSSSLQDQKDADTRVFQLPNGGGFHVCAGRMCPHVSVCVTAVEKEYVCNLVGVVVCKTMEASGDSGWTGRSVASADPDQTSGGVSSSAWRAKRDAFLTSQNAWARAKVISTEDILSDEEDAPGGASSERAPAYTNDANSKPTKQSKRGAPCVVDTSDVATREMRREKSTRRIQSLMDSSTMERLRKDASSVVCKLLSVPVESEASSGGATSSSSSASATAAGTDASSLEDPRLQNYDFVFMVGLRRYMARCNAESTVPLLDTINNIAITASNFVRERKRAAKNKREGGTNPAVVRSVIHSGQCIDHTAALICAMWTACCETPAFRDAQFGDSFKPFAAGVLYAMKNGIAMTDMQKEEFELIPQMRLFSDQLPTLKTSASNQSARQLQSSSHKGMCAIHRAIASLNDIKDTSVREAIMLRFKQAARVGFRVLEYVLTQVSVLSSQIQ